MRPCSNSSVLQLIDAIAIAIAQGYMLARARLVSHPSPMLRLTAVRDALAWETALLERELAVFRQARGRIPPKQRPHYTPTHRLEILQIMRLRQWSVDDAAKRFVLHPNTIRGWREQLRTHGESSRLFTGPIWNRLHDAVRWTVHELRRLCPQAECGTRTIARHIMHAAVQISRSSVQRILREELPRRRYDKSAMLPLEGADPHHLLAPLSINRVWQIDMMQLRLLWSRFTIASLVDGFSRKLLRLKVYAAVPTTADMLRVLKSAIRSHGQPRFLITDHGGQFRKSFTTRLKPIGVAAVKGKVRQPSFNGKVERFFRTMRLWLRSAVLPIGIASLQRELDRYRAWYNEHRPHAALGGRTPEEVWHGVDMPEAIPIRVSDADEIDVHVQRRSFGGDPALPIIAIRVERKEAA